MTSSFAANYAVLALGWLGLVAIGAVPIRSLMLLRRAYQRMSAKRLADLLGFGLLIVATAGLVSFDINVSMRIFQCLTSSYCGPSTASGWLYLGLLGLVYGAFELLLIVVAKVRNFYAASAKKEFS